MVNELAWNNILIPNEISETIFSKLSGSQLCKIATVCNDWLQISERNSLWVPIVIKECRILYDVGSYLTDISWKSAYKVAVLEIKKILASGEGMQGFLIPTCRYNKHEDFKDDDAHYGTSF